MASGLGHLTVSPSHHTPLFLDQCAHLCDGLNHPGHPRFKRDKLGLPHQDTPPGAESVTGKPIYPDESLCGSADGPLGDDFSLCDLRTRGVTEPSSAPAFLQPLEPPSDQRVASNLDVSRAIFGIEGPSSRNRPPHFSFCISATWGPVARPSRPRPPHSSSLSSHSQINVLQAILTGHERVLASEVPSSRNRPPRFSFRLSATWGPVARPSRPRPSHSPSPWSHI